MDNYNDYLMHFGIKGMRWGVRRYQNKDGSLTEEGRKHVNNYEKLNKLRDKTNSEGQKLFKADKRLKRDFGSFDQIDDFDFFELTAREYGINTDDFWNASAAQSKFYRENRESINLGKEITNKLLKKMK